MMNIKKKRSYLPYAPEYKRPTRKTNREKDKSEKEKKNAFPFKAAGKKRTYLPCAPEVKTVKAGGGTSAEAGAEKNRKKADGKLIAVIVLAVLLAAQSGLCVFLGTRNKESAPAEASAINIALDTAALGTEVAGAVSDVAGRLVSGMEKRIMPGGSIADAVRSVVYSDAVVNMIMSISYPLLYDTLVGMELLDFAENVSLYPTGPQYAKLIEGKGYTATDKDGKEKPLTEILQAVGSDWKYMDSKVSVTKADGSAAQSSIWNTIKWGVTDKASFYTAMENMSLGLRGILEVTVQHKEKVVNINPVEYLLGFGGIDIRMDAATVYADTEKSGYSLCLIPLFEMLGLKPGEFPEDAVVCAYEKPAQIWMAIIEPVLTAVDKAVKAPVNVLPDMLVNFADRLESGKLKESMLALRLDGDYSDIASLAMGYEDGLIFNLGDALLKIVGSLGIDIGGSFNDCLDSLLAMITKREDADMPDMDITRLKENSSAVTLPDGNTVIKADSEKVADYLVEYAVNENIVSVILEMTPLAGSEAAGRITAAVGESKVGIREIVNVITDIALEKYCAAE